MAPDMPGEQHSNIKYEEEFIKSPRGVKLFTCKWVPANRQAKALICLCHGYGLECSVFMEDTGMRLAKAGYAVFGIDYEGHGKSAGTRCYIKNFDDLVADCATFFRSVADRIEYREKARFLYGEAMGGAVALLIHRKQLKCCACFPYVQVSENILEFHNQKRSQLFDPSPDNHIPESMLIADNENIPEFDSQKNRSLKSPCFDPKSGNDFQKIRQRFAQKLVYSC